MPTYRVSDKVSGAVLDLTGDAPPTDEDLDKIFSPFQAAARLKQDRETPPLPVKSVMGSVGEAIGSALNVPAQQAMAIPADIATIVSGQESPFDWQNMKAATMQREMPITQKINEAASESPTAATIANISQGLASVAPYIATGNFPATAQRLMALGFSAQMILGVKDLATQYGDEMGKPPEQRDQAKITQLQAALIQTPLFTSLLAVGAKRGGLTGEKRPVTPVARPQAAAPTKTAPAVETPVQPQAAAPPAPLGGFPMADKLKARLDALKAQLPATATKIEPKQATSEPSYSPQDLARWNELTTEQNRLVAENKVGDKNGLTPEWTANQAAKDALKAKYQGGTPERVEKPTTKSPEISSKLVVEPPPTAPELVEARRIMPADVLENIDDPHPSLPNLRVAQVEDMNKLAAAIKGHQPIPAIGLKQPEGYVREGDQYVFKPTAPAPKAAKEPWQMTKEMFGGEVRVDKTGQQSLFAKGKTNERLLRGNQRDSLHDSRGLSEGEVTKSIQEVLGTKELPKGIKVVRDEGATWGAKITGRNEITVNASQISTPARVRAVIMEEGLHGVWDDPAVRQAWEPIRDSVTAAEMRAEYLKRKAQGLPTDAATIREEAAISKLLKLDADKGIAAKVYDVIRAAIKRVFGIDLPANNRQALKDAATAFLRREEKGQTAKTKYAVGDAEKAIDDSGAVRKNGIGIQKFFTDDVLKNLKGISGGVAQLARIAKTDFHNLFAPESASPNARATDALAAKYVQTREQIKQAFQKQTENQSKFWDAMPEDARLKTMHALELGVFSEGKPEEFKKLVQFELFPDEKAVQRAANKVRAEQELKSAVGKFLPQVKVLMQQYRDRFDADFRNEKTLGIDINYRANYFPHLWKDVGEATRVFKDLREKLGGDRYAKLRELDLIELGLKKGLELVDTNPETLALKRDFDSARIVTQQSFVNHLESIGLAEEAKAGGEYGGSTILESPNGKKYAIPPDVAAVVNNAFFQKSLWENKSIVGTGFRGLMNLKNLFIPVKLGLSLFHPVHIVGIDNAARLANIIEAVKDKNLSFSDAVSLAVKSQGNFFHPKGKQFVDAYNRYGWDKSMPADMQQSIQHMIEGGFNPNREGVWKSKSGEGFRRAVSQGNYPGAAIRGIPAALQMMQKPIFDMWIPRLRAAGFDVRARELFRTRPELLDDAVQRAIELRKISKEIDNQYGEMNYSTLFWNRYMRDTGVGMSLSMGWNLGFLREFGGGAIDFGKAGVKLAQMKRPEITNKMLFTSIYTAQAMLFGGLATWALTGKPPTQFLDYFYPKTGEKNDDGSDERLSTPYYTREYFMAVSHIQKDGVIGGTAGLIAGKSNPLLAPLIELFKNKDYFGYEIHDPHSPYIEQAEQVAEFLGKSAMPISVASGIESKASTKAKVASYAGFNPAPRYITRTAIQNDILSIYERRYGGEEQKPYSKRLEFEAKQAIKEAKKSGDTEKVQELELEARHNKVLTARQVTYMHRANIPADVFMWKRLPESDKQALRSKMTDEEKKRYPFKD